MTRLNCRRSCLAIVVPFLQDGMTVQIEYHEAEALHATLPQKVTCKIVETEPVVKGQTAANSFKPAVLDNGVESHGAAFCWAR